MTNVIVSMDHILLEADYSDPSPHKHLSKHLIISLNEDLTCFIENKKISCRGIIINSNITHTIKSNSNKILVFLFNETISLSQELEKVYLKENQYYLIDSNQIENIINIWNYEIKSYIDNKSNYILSYKKILKELNLTSYSPHIQDERINKVLTLIENIESINEHTLEFLSRNVFLSKSRLSHLFKYETGITLSSFLVMCKISKAYNYILKGYSITDSSLMAGFNSSSHFATTNKNMFGLSANKLFNDINVIFI